MMTVDECVSRLAALRFRLNHLGQRWHDNKWQAVGSAYESSIADQPFGRGETPGAAMAELVDICTKLRKHYGDEADLGSLG